MEVATAADLWTMACSPANAEFSAMEIAIPEKVHSSIGDGMIIPGVMFLLSGLIDTWKSRTPYGLKLMYSATGVGISAFVGCFYAKNTAMKNMFEKARKAQNKGSQLASEALLTSTALSFWYGGRFLNQGLVSSKQLFQAFFILMRLVHSSIGDGMIIPGVMFLLSGLIDTYGNLEPRSSDISSANCTVDKYGLKLMYLATGVGISAFVAIDISLNVALVLPFVDKNGLQDSSSTTFQVISGVSSDVQSIQDVIAEKVSMGILFLAAVPLTLLFIAPGLGLRKLMMKLGMKMKDSYGVAGEIAEQAISSIRMVYSSVGERQTQNRFSKALQKYTELGLQEDCMQYNSQFTYFTDTWVRAHNDGFWIFRHLMSALPNISFFAEAKAAATRISELIDQVPRIDTEDQKG
ncbi:hypothetical protein C3L33_13929, partial [Rhododendron williamsianum]